MSDSTEILLHRATEYANQLGAELLPALRLGFGVHGSVFVCRHKDRPARTAVKVHERLQSYVRERDAYLRLREANVSRIRGHHIPILLNYHDALWVIEMTIVTRPFVLDFGGAYVDRPPEFSSETLADWRREKQEQFEDRWPEVEEILRELRQFGIYVSDVNPGNIAFGGA
jgi:hypothetical protein